MSSLFHAVRSYYEKNLLSMAFIAGFIVSVFFIMVFLFPKQQILNEALTLGTPEKITQFYLLKLNAAEPSNALTQMALIEQTIGLHEWQAATTLIDQLGSNPAYNDEVTRLKFINAYEQAFQQPKGPLRSSAINQLKLQLPSLLHLNLSADQLKRLGDIALKLESPQLSLSFYEAVVAMKGEQSPDFYVTLSNIALQSSQYEAAAHYAEMAADRESLMELKRQDIILALKAYQAGNLFKEAAALLSQCDHQLLNNKPMLIFVTQYALSINRPDLAEVFIKRALLNNWGGL